MFLLAPDELYPSSRAIPVRSICHHPADYSSRTTFPRSQVRGSRTNQSPADQTRPVQQRRPVIRLTTTRRLGLSAAHQAVHHRSQWRRRRKQLPVGHLNRPKRCRSRRTGDRWNSHRIANAEYKRETKPDRTQLA